MHRVTGDAYPNSVEALWERDCKTNPEAQEKFQRRKGRGKPPHEKGLNLVESKNWETLYYSVSASAGDPEKKGSEG